MRFSSAATASPLRAALEAPALREASKSYWSWS